MEYQLILGDTIEEMKKLPSESVDLVVTSPPYNVGVKYQNWDDNMAWNDYWQFTREWLGQCERVLKVGGRICLNCPNLGNSPSNGKSNGLYFFLPTMGQSLQQVGLTIRECITWVKTFTDDIKDLEIRSSTQNTAWGSWLSPSTPYCRSISEFILIAHKKTPKLQGKGKTDLTPEEFMSFTRNVWLMPSGQFNPNHPAPYPEELPRRCIKLYSWIGDTILDPFLGSGTTGVVAKKLNRKFIGIDNSPVYLEHASDRINKTMAALGKEPRRLAPNITIAPLFPA